MDFDFDGVPDSETRCVADLRIETVFRTTNQLGIWRQDFFTNGVIRESRLDRDRDGRFDERILFDAFETFLRVEPQ